MLHVKIKSHRTHEEPLTPTIGAQEIVILPNVKSQKQTLTRDPSTNTHGHRQPERKSSESRNPKPQNRPNYATSTLPNNAISGPFPARSRPIPGTFHTAKPAQFTAQTSQTSPESNNPAKQPPRGRAPSKDKTESGLVTSLRLVFYFELIE